MRIVDNFEFMKRWDFDKNDISEKEIESIKSSSGKSVWFKCGAGHSYKRAISTEFRKHSCKHCKSLAYNVPEVIDMFTKGNKKNPWDLSVGSEEIVELYCEKHGVFERMVKYISRTKRQGGTPCTKCNSEKRRDSTSYTNDDNNLFKNYPNLIPLWSEKNEKRMDSFAHGSDHKVWWKCDKEMGHPDYIQSIYQKARMGTGCPYCSGRKVSKSNSFAVSFPEYMNLWSDKNKKSPYEYTPFSNAKVWFKCENGLHDDYLQTINNKSNGKFCMECGRERTRIGTIRPKSERNTLGSKRPDLIDLWSDKNSMTINDYNYGTDQHLWWKCEKGIHEDYLQRASNKVFKGYKCPECNLSRGEGLIGEILNKNGVPYISEYSLIDVCSARGGVLRFDFYIPSINTFIEYDGIQHFEPIEYFGGIEAFELQVRNDEIKDEYCKVNGVNLLRIPYYMSDSEVDEMVRECLESVGIKIREIN